MTQWIILFCVVRFGAVQVKARFNPDGFQPFRLGFQGPDLFRPAVLLRQVRFRLRPRLQQRQREVRLAHAHGVKPDRAAPFLQLAASRRAEDAEPFAVRRLVSGPPDVFHDQAGQIEQKDDRKKAGTQWKGKSGKSYDESSDY